MAAAEAIPPIVWDGHSAPCNPRPLIPWPTRFRITNPDTMPYDQGPNQNYSFPLNVWESGRETFNQLAFANIIEHHCPAQHAVSLGQQNREFAAMEEVVAVDRTGAGLFMTYKAAKAKYVEGRTAAAGHLGGNNTPSIQSSSEGSFDHSDYDALRPVNSEPEGDALIKRLLSSPQTPDITADGAIWNRLNSMGQRPKRPCRCILTVEVKPRTGFHRTRRHIVYLIQLIKYAIMARVMCGTRHALLTVGMSFRRVVCDRESNDIYIDIGTTTADGQPIEIEEMSLIKMLWYGYLTDPPTLPTPSNPDPSPTLSASPSIDAAAATAGMKHSNKKGASRSKTKAKDSVTADAARNLFYHLSAPPSLSDPPSPSFDVTARQALASFLDHMGQAHFDVLRQEPSIGHPLQGLSGRWAKVANVSLEDIGWVAEMIASRWSDLPRGTTTAGSTQDGLDDGDMGGAGEDPSEGDDEGDHDESGGRGKDVTASTIDNSSNIAEMNELRSSLDTIRGDPDCPSSSSYFTPAQSGFASSLRVIAENSLNKSPSNGHHRMTSPAGSSSESVPLSSSPHSEPRLLTPVDATLGRETRPVIESNPTRADQNSAVDNAEQMYDIPDVEISWDELGVTRFKRQREEFAIFDTAR